MANNPPPDSESRMPDDGASETDVRYRRAARLLAQKLGLDWRDLPPEQVQEYLRKIEIADAHRRSKPRP